MMSDIKWTDEMQAWASVVQAVVIFFSAVFAFIQVKTINRWEQTRSTDEVFRNIETNLHGGAIGRRTADLDPHKNETALLELLRRSDDDDDRSFCEDDIHAITSLYSAIWLKFDKQLIDRSAFLEEYDELTLFVVAALTKAEREYHQPDYRGLFRLSRHCQHNYVRAEGRYSILKSWPIPIVPDNPPRPLFRSLSPLRHFFDW